MPNSGCFMAQKTHSSKTQRKRERQFDMEIIQLFYCPCVTKPSLYLYIYFQIKPASKILPPLHSTLQRHLRKSTNFTIPQ